MAPAPTRSGQRRPSTSSSSDRTRTLLIVALALAVALAGYLLWRAHSSSASTLDSSGTPGPDRTGPSSSLAPSGGAAGGDAGQLPMNLVSQPDPVQQQVQQAAAGSSESPTMLGPTIYSSPLTPAIYQPAPASTFITAGAPTGGGGAITVPTGAELQYRLLAAGGGVSGQQQQQALQQQLIAARETHSGFARVPDA